MDSKLLCAICVVLLILIFALFSYGMTTVVESNEIADQVQHRNKHAKTVGKAEVDPDSQRRVHIYARPHFSSLMHTALENNLPLYYDFGPSSSLFSTGNHVAFGEGGPDHLGSIDSGDLMIKITMIAPDETPIEVQRMSGAESQIFGRNGLFDDYVRFGVRGGKMKIEVMPKN